MSETLWEVRGVRGNGGQSVVLYQRSSDIEVVVPTATYPLLTPNQARILARALYRLARNIEGQAR